ncbi:MAG: hypothetical protein ACI4SM_04105 [Candidatus Gastranaerophilaceae bacterium]
MTVDLRLVSNPFAKAENPSEEKIAKMKQDQEDRRASLFAEMEQYRAAYRSQEKKYAEAKSVFLMEQRELNRVDKNNVKYAEQKSKYAEAKKIFTSERSEKDLRLSLLQFHSDNYVKASRINILDLV